MSTSAGGFRGGPVALFEALRGGRIAHAAGCARDLKPANVKNGGVRGEVCDVIGTGKGWGCGPGRHRVGVFLKWSAIALRRFGNRGKDEPVRTEHMDVMGTRGICLRRCGRMWVIGSGDAAMFIAGSFARFLCLGCRTSGQTNRRRSQRSAPRRRPQTEGR